jgi:hypothetical protein
MSTCGFQVIRVADCRLLHLLQLVFELFILADDFILNAVTKIRIDGVSNILVLTRFRLAARHRDEGSRFSRNDFQVMDHKAVIKGNSNVRLELTPGANPLDANVRDLHGAPPDLPYPAGTTILIRQTTTLQVFEEPHAGIALLQAPVHGLRRPPIGEYTDCRRTASG